jgi:hypothetical protein
VHTEAGRKIQADEVVWCTSAGEIHFLAQRIFYHDFVVYEFKRENSRGEPGERAGLDHVFHAKASYRPLMCRSAFLLHSQGRPSG